MSRNILVCVAWPYVNSEPHLGHIAGMNVPADIFARFHRMIGNRVAMVSGSDMHGTPTALRAVDEGVRPEDIAFRYHEIWSDCMKRMGFSYDLYTHTHTKIHEDVSQDVMLTLDKHGYIYEDKQLMPYSETEQRFLSDRFVEGICPVCGFDGARGDQCDGCGRTLDAIDLIDIRSIRDGSVPVFKETTHLMIKLSAFQEQLEKWVETKNDWRPNVRNQTIGFLNEGLHDRAMTRDIEWGIPVPFEGYDKKRIYVWFEAVIGYFSATKAWAIESDDADAWTTFWHNPDAESYYFQGKDNIPFHTVLWPAMLMGYGGLNLPTDVVANEYLNLDGQGFSSSRNWAVWLPDYLERYDVDPLRYYLASIMPETSDSDFTWEGFFAANNNVLVATLGNFVHRTLTITTRNFDGRVPDPGDLAQHDQEALDACEETFDDVAESIETRRFRRALSQAMELARVGNRYLDAEQPWRTVKSNPDKAAKTLWTALNIISTLRTVFYPFIPFSSDKMHDLLGFDGATATDGWRRRVVEPGSPLSKPRPLFRKLDPEIVEEERARLVAQQSGK